MAEKKETSIIKVITLGANLDRLIPFSPFRFFSKLIFILSSKVLKNACLNEEQTDSLAVGYDLYYMIRAMLYSALRIRWKVNSLNIFLKAIFQNDDAPRIKNEWRKKFKEGPPGFLVISPTKSCNLSCPNCYANAAKEVDKLPKDIFERIIQEAFSLWGVRFFVISGGEPLLYRDKGFTLLDLLTSFPNAIFMLYTNGLLIDENIAERMAEMGNVTPAISVEGLKERTDERRGEGTFEKILSVMERLKRNKVLFGISLTATRFNCEEILSDEFIDFFFKKMGAAYGWIFHYMPIGRDVDISLMPTPKQRVWMWKRSWEIVKRKKIMLVDFWNHGTASHGCIAGGREGGYFHINWQGECAPCVFFPFATSNILDIYKSGGSLNDVLFSPFFKAIREWQKNYGFLSFGKVKGDWLRPCPIRDHFKEARKVVKEYGAWPIDYAKSNYVDEEDYFNEMKKYDEELARLTKDIWEKVYLNHTFIQKKD